MASPCVTQVQGERFLGESRALWWDQRSLAGGHQLTVEEISHLLVQQWPVLLRKSITVLVTASSLAIQALPTCYLSRISRLW